MMMTLMLKMMFFVERDVDVVGDVDDGHDVDDAYPCGTTVREGSLSEQRRKNVS